ncbi:MAG: type I-C CRISPR-associated endonuclease Cas1c [Chloroflexota bacterium]
MHELLNVLYVQAQGTTLRLEHDAVRIEQEGELKLRLPLARLSGIVAIGQVTISSRLLARCGEDGRGVVWLDYRGRFLARVEGRVRGNVLLRRAQHLALSDPDRATLIARQITAAKIQNSRGVLLRAARDAGNAADRTALQEAAARLAAALDRLRSAPSIAQIRGEEGEAARSYFGAFTHMVRGDRVSFSMDGRSRRPPRDRLNAVLSFLYSVLRAECETACEAVGLDPQVGYLHALRPGRPALALDLLEEFRAPVADRLALTLINRQQVAAADFDEHPGGAIMLNESGRKTVITAYQQRKQDEIPHRVLDRKIPLGLVPFIQARLLARHLRGDLVDYPPFVSR